MSQEFATMLKSTLEKMQQRINEANKQWEEENDANMLKHFENVQLKWLFITVKSHRRLNLSPL